MAKETATEAFIIILKQALIFKSLCLHLSQTRLSATQILSKKKKKKRQSYIWERYCTNVLSEYKTHNEYKMQNEWWLQCIKDVMSNHFLLLTQSIS